MVLYCLGSTECKSSNAILQTYFDINLPGGKFYAFKKPLLLMCHHHSVPYT